MSTPRKGKAFWDRVEQAGKAMEVSLRLVFGFMFACGLSALAWWVGSHVWLALAVLVAVLTFPIGFVPGFFWLEVKSLLHLFFGSLSD